MKGLTSSRKVLKNQNDLRKFNLIKADAPWLWFVDKREFDEEVLEMSSYSKRSRTFEIYPDDSGPARPDYILLKVSVDEKFENYNEDRHADTLNENGRAWLKTNDRADGDAFIYGKQPLNKVVSTARRVGSDVYLPSGRIDFS